MVEKINAAYFAHIDRIMTAMIFALVVAALVCFIQIIIQDIKQRQKMCRERE